MYALLGVLVSLIGHLFQSLYFLNFSNSSSDLKRPKWHYVTVMGKKIDITRIQSENMSTKHEMLCGQKIWNSNNKLKQVGISVKRIPTCFLSTLKCVAVWLQLLSWS